MLRIAMVVDVLRNLVGGYDALRYLAGRPWSACESVTEARRALAELGLGETVDSVRIQPTNGGWRVRATQTIESDEQRLRAWLGRTVTLEEVEPASLPVSRGLFASSMGRAGFKEPVPLVFDKEWLAAFAPHDVDVAHRVPVAVRIRLLARARPSMDGLGLVTPRASSAGLDSTSFALLLMAMFLWTPADLPYVAHRLVEVADRSLAFGGRPLVQGVYRLRDLSFLAGAAHCVHELDTWLELHAERYGLTPPSAPPTFGAAWAELQFAVPLGAAHVRDVLERTAMEDVRDAIPALGQAVETGAVEAGVAIVERLLDRARPTPADRQRGRNVDDFVELCGMALDVSGDHERAARCFAAALEMPTIVDSPFRRWWLERRIATGPRFFLQTRWRVVGRDRDYMI
ncbi:MAG: hypothetical protein H6724_15605 [Sandaracinus sp.]|nr:hypothetical protein [Sandaracinus sp.]